MMQCLSDNTVKQSEPGLADSTWDLKPHCDYVNCGFNVGVANKATFSLFHPFIWDHYIITLHYITGLVSTYKLHVEQQTLQCHTIIQQYGSCRTYMHIIYR